MPHPYPWPSTWRVPLFRDRGFTILELLLYGGLSAVVLWMAVSALVSNVRSNSSMLRSLRMIDRWGRLSTLLDTEIAEGMSISYPRNLPRACGGGSLSGTPAVQVDVPYLNSSNQIAVGSITYFNQAGTFYRCGPPFFESGRLDHGQAAVLSPISTGTTFAINTAVPAGQDASRTLSYTIQFLDNTGRALFSRSATARTRVRLFN
ncbi:MAG: hypothetical protein VKI83_07915 [Synechococcaceae cyanobacterium]|nr:hypothetical protein [Synechococcaceae cyanobacterium]